MDGASLSKKEGERKLGAHYLFVTERLGRAGGSELIGTCPENRNSEPDDDSRAQEFGLFVKSTKFFFCSLFIRPTVLCRRYANHSGCLNHVIVHRPRFIILFKDVTVNFILNQSFLV